MGKRGPNPEVTADDIFSIFTELDDPCEPLTTADIAEELDIAQRTALKQLKRTENETPLKSKKIGARARVWWLPYECNSE
jgi:Mn-dependent DtxR family transcriptional regulator